MWCPTRRTENSPPPLPSAFMASSAPSLSDPPWPPDLCVVHREPLVPDLISRPSVSFHPEASASASPKVESVPSHSPSSLSPSALAPAHVDLRVSTPVASPAPAIVTPSPPFHPLSPSPALWVSKLTSSPHNLKKLSSPTFSADGTPTVKAPDSVVFRPSQTWKGYLVAQFHGNPPSPTKIFNDLNPIWGKQGRIRVKYHSKGVYMIYIPCEVLRQWVLDVGFWHSGNCSFTVSEWTPNLVLTKMKLDFAPVWVLFKNVPIELWSFEGFSSFASGVGFPVQSEFPKLKPYSNGIIKLKVVIKLDGKKPKVVKVVDKMGNSVSVYAEYLKLPPKCGICSEFGHFDMRCPTPSIQAPSPKLVIQVSSSSSESPGHNSATNQRTSPKSSRPPFSRVSSSVSSPPAVPDRSLRRSISLPGSPVRSVHSVTNTGPSEWVKVGSRSPPAKALKSKSPPRSKQAKPLSSSQFGSEEELISAAQKIIRNRFANEDGDIPPFSSVADRKQLRKFQRQTYRSLCEDEGGTSSGSGGSVNHHQDPITFGSNEATLPKQASPFLEA